MLLPVLILISFREKHSCEVKLSEMGEWETPLERQCNDTGFVHVAK